MDLNCAMQLDTDIRLKPAVVSKFAPQSLWTWCAAVGTGYTRNLLTQKLVIIMHGFDKWQYMQPSQPKIGEHDVWLWEMAVHTTFSPQNLVNIMYVYGKWLHTPPSHPKLGEPQAFT